MSTYQAKAGEIPAKWFLINLEGRVLGRAATQIAAILRGKNKPTFTPNADTGDFVVVINASKLRLTGRKMEQKVYYRHTGYPGGIRERKASKLVGTRPDIMVKEAVKGMLPKSVLGRSLLGKLKVYSGAEHPHVAQVPQEIKV